MCYTTAGLASGALRKQSIQNAIKKKLPLMISEGVLNMLDFQTYFFTILKDFSFCFFWSKTETK